jgi:hypothetical protein
MQIPDVYTATQKPTLSFPAWLYNFSRKVQKLPIVNTALWRDADNLTTNMSDSYTLSAIGCVEIWP